MMNLRLMAIAALTIGALALTACGQADSTSDTSAVPSAVPAMVKERADTMAKDSGGAMATKQMTETMAMNEDDSDAMATKQMTETMAMDEGDAMATEPMTRTMAMEKGQDDAIATKPMTKTMAIDEDHDDAMALPAWFSARLTDVISGQPFTIAGNKGKVVLVETLAVWCSNCLKQQKQVLILHEALGERDDFVSIGLDIDLNESPDQLKGHAERNGFDWVYGVATADVAREIGKLYGNQFLNPPSTPMLIVDRNGEVHPLPFGIKSAEELKAALEPFLNEAM